MQLISIRCVIGLVVTVLTVYGIETRIEGDKLVFMEVVTVLTVYGIETGGRKILALYRKVVTVLTVYGIETFLTTAVLFIMICRCNSTYRLRY